MQFPASTGQVARLLHVREPYLNDLLRRGKIDPAPPIYAGRRAWGPEHTLQAGLVTGTLSDDSRKELEELIGQLRSAV